MDETIAPKEKVESQVNRDPRVRGSQFTRSQFRKVDGTKSTFASPAVSDQELAMWRDTLKLFGEKEEISARYKVEILFGARHTVRSLAYGSITAWENGAKLKGGGDILLYSCPGKYQGMNGCEAVLPSGHNAKIVVCPSCLVAWKIRDLIGQTYYRLPLQKWAEVVYGWYRRLDMDADIHVKYHYDDIRVATGRELERDRGGEVLWKARSSERRRPRVYPLENIIKDVNAGADLQKRILSFLQD